MKINAEIGLYYIGLTYRVCPRCQGYVNAIIREALTRFQENGGLDASAMGKTLCFIG